ncbi:23217_t:CDS:2, partial [Dentiscutata erythropus]
IAEKDHLSISESVNTEIYSEGEEPGKVNNGNSIEQPIINLASHTFRMVKNCSTYEKKEGQKLKHCLPNEYE